MKMQILNNRYYAIFQVGIWGTFMLYEAITYTLISNNWKSIFLNVSFNFFVGIGLTHLYRNLALRFGWLNLNFRQIIPIMLVASFVITCLMAFINIPLDKLTFKDFFQSLNFVQTLSYFMNWSKYIAVWFLIYHMYVLQEKNFAERLELLKNLKEIEFQQLKSQLQPHFLFNALNSIRALIEMEPSKAKQAVTALSDLLRNSIRSTQKQWVPFYEELQTVENYLLLEKIRYEDRLLIELNINDDTLNLAFPPMMLQTLVENAIKHGISKLKKGGTISISSFIKSDFWYIIIRNDGQYSPAEQHQGIGLKNTQNRLQLLFPNAHEFTITNTNEQKVSLELKIRKDKVHHLI